MALKIVPVKGRVTHPQKNKPDGAVRVRDQHSKGSSLKYIRDVSVRGGRKKMKELGYDQEKQGQAEPAPMIFSPYIRSMPGGPSDPG